jgi:hypothetical protein
MWDFPPQYDVEPKCNIFSPNLHEQGAYVREVSLQNFRTLRRTVPELCSSKDQKRALSDAHGARTVALMMPIFGMGV